MARLSRPGLQRVVRDRPGERAFEERQVHQLPEEVADVAYLAVIEHLGDLCADLGLRRFGIHAFHQPKARSEQAREDAVAERQVAGAAAVDSRQAVLRRFGAPKGSLRRCAILPTPLPPTRVAMRVCLSALTRSAARLRAAITASLPTSGALRSPIADAPLPTVPDMEGESRLVLPPPQRPDALNSPAAPASGTTQRVIYLGAAAPDVVPVACRPGLIQARPA